ncbi:hypothetical protein [Xenorhabdus sp. SGI240]|uniref:hypothetical protein n=1 Tax=Xenorhabdus sp. SGI240 TaxID=3158262 RepID=UPI0032B82282
MSKKNAVVLVSVAILAFASGFAAKEAISLVDFDSKEIAKAKEIVRERLKDPDSAVFEDMVENPHIKGVVCGSYNAKNSYGGYGGKTKFIMSTLWSADGAEIETYDSTGSEEQKKAFLERWISLCT